MFLSGVRAFRHPKHSRNWNSNEKYSLVIMRQSSWKGVLSITEWWITHCGVLGAPLPAEARVRSVGSSVAVLARPASARGAGEKPVSRVSVPSVTVYLSLFCYLLNELCSPVPFPQKDERVLVFPGGRYSKNCLTLTWRTWCGTARSSHAALTLASHRAFIPCVHSTPLTSSMCFFIFQSYWRM